MFRHTLRRLAMLRAPVCECGQVAELVMGDVVYPEVASTHHKHYWLCRPCDAWTSCHENSPSLKPTGRLANAELRAEKRKTHGAFDVLWMVGFHRISRFNPNASKSSAISIAYGWLAERMGMPAQRCHIGAFTIEQCILAQSICRNLGHELMERYNVSTQPRT